MQWSEHNTEAELKAERSQAEVTYEILHSPPPSTSSKPSPTLPETVRPVRGPPSYPWLSLHSPTSPPIISLGVGRTAQQHELSIPFHSLEGGVLDQVQALLPLSCTPSLPHTVGDNPVISAQTFMSVRCSFHPNIHRVLL